jgi:hypothetical protein
VITKMPSTIHIVSITTLGFGEWTSGLSDRRRARFFMTGRPSFYGELRRNTENHSHSPAIPRKSSQLLAKRAEYCKLLSVRVLRHIPPSANTAYGTEGCAFESRGVC